MRIYCRFCQVYVGSFTSLYDYSVRYCVQLLQDGVPDVETRALRVI